MQRLNTLDHLLGRIEEKLLCFFLFAMVLLAFLQVVSRNLFATGIVWAEAIVRLLVLWVGLFGAMLATKRGQHLGIDVFTKFLGERPKRVVGLCIKLFSTVVCLYLFKAGFDFVLLEIDSGSDFLEHVPFWAAEIIIPVAFIVMPFHFLVSSLNDLKSLFQKTSS